MLSVHVEQHLIHVQLKTSMILRLVGLTIWPIAPLKLTHHTVRHLTVLMPGLKSTMTVNLIFFTLTGVL